MERVWSWVQGSKRVSRIEVSSRVERVGREDMGGSMVMGGMKVMTGKEGSIWTVVITYENEFRRGRRMKNRFDRYSGLKNI